MKLFYLLSFIFFSIIGDTQAIITREGFDPDQSAKWAQKSFSNVCEVVVSYDNKEGGSFGSGVLISPTCVLTAAHVVRAGQMLNPKQPPIVDFGQMGCKFNSGAPFRFIETIIPHPNHGMNQDCFCEGTDLAILKFNEPIADIVPVKLWDAKIADNRQGYIAGYGKSGTSKTGATIEPHIRHMGTTRVTRSDSDYIYYDYQPLNYSYGQIPDTFMITETTDKLQSLPIGSDSGGPLLFGSVTDLSVAGIAHGGSVYQIAESENYACFKWIPIAPHLEWIKENM